MPLTPPSLPSFQGLNMEMVGAEALAALFGVYGDVKRVKMMPEQESALVEVRMGGREGGREEGRR